MQQELPISPQLAEAAGRVRQHAAGLQQAQIAFLSDLVRLETITGREGPAAERTLAEMRRWGFHDLRMDGAGQALGCVGRGQRRLMYDAHLDVNEVADAADWPHPPLEPVIENGKLFGLGASDCKGGVAAIVYGAALANRLDLTADCTITVAGSTLEEDAEGFAMRHLLADEAYPAPEAVLLAEATDLTLRRGHRGRCEIKVRIAGRAAHASTPYLGDNAILKARPVLDALEGMAPGLPVDPVLGKGTQVVTMVASPHTPNSVPSWCELTIDRRLTPGETSQSVVAGIEKAVAGLDATVFLSMQPVVAWTGLDLSGPAFFPGWLLEADNLLLTAGKLVCQALWGEAPPVDVWKFSTNGTYSGGVAGIPTLGFGPMEERFVHTHLDQVDLEKLLKGAMFYALFPLAYSMVTRNSAGSHVY